MRFTPLAVLKHRIHAGSALPFNVYDHDRTLLFARGIPVESAQVQRQTQLGNFPIVATGVGAQAGTHPAPQGLKGVEPVQRVQLQCAQVAAAPAF